MLGSATVLKVENLSKQYSTAQGPLPILSEVTFSLAPGDSMSIIGPSGVGKSTLLYVLGALDPPTTGTVTLDGENPFTLPESELAVFRNSQVGFVFQDHLLLPQCTVLENVLLPTLVAAADASIRERAVELIDQVGLKPRLEHRPGELSGGERQRVALARALIRQPQLLLCDEPTGNLDRESADTVSSLLFDLHRQRQAILVVVTHNVVLAQRCAKQYKLTERTLEPVSLYPMTIPALIRRNLLHFWRTNLAVVVGVGVAVAVLAGALLVGSSVRASLQSLALERLGSVDTVVTSASFVQESLAEKVLDTGSAREWFGGGAPIIAVEGFVTHQESGRRASGVQVYGVDDRFWDFHEQNAESLTLERNRVFVSEGLASELGVTVDDSVLVRVELPSAIPISSLHGRRDDLGRTLRLGIERVLPPEAEGEFSFRPQQGRARSVFVSLTRLQQALEQEGRVNTVLLGVGNLTSGGSVEAATRLTAAESAVRSAASLDLSLIHI